MAIPTYDHLFNPILKAMHALGGSGSVSEIEDKVAEVMGLSDEDLDEIHEGNRSVFSYRLAWARTYLKRYGLLNNSARGVWSLTVEGNTVDAVDPEVVKKMVKKTRKEKVFIEEENSADTHTKPEARWEDELLEEILKLKPDAFERLSQRLLRESGFIQVEVTGKSGDGGIDGRGVIRLGSLLSFHVIFQCKRYIGTVGAKEIRDFRGAMSGRTDKGIFITTGIFSRDAKLEATRDGVPPIDLIDGELLVNLLKDLNMGVKVSNQEIVEIETNWLLNEI